MSETKTLVTIQQISRIRKHINADRLCIATVQGYEVILNPESFGESMQTFEQLVGRKGIMFYIDSVIPTKYENLDVFAFLTNSLMGKRVKTIKIRGEYSQGLFLPLNSLNIDESEPIGTDLTSRLGVVKFYSKEDTENTSSDSSSQSFPIWFPKTNQPRLQEQTNLLSNCEGRTFVVTIKVDGQSATFYHNAETKETGMCSRNYRLGCNDVPEQFNIVNRKYSILEKLSSSPINIAVQGELYGRGINGNRLGLNNFDFIVFDIYEWDELGGRYWPYDKVVQFCKKNDFQVVPNILTTTTVFDLNRWLNLAESQTYDQLSPKKGLPAEGIVVKTCDGQTPYVSFKVISRLYLNKHNL